MSEDIAVRLRSLANDYSRGRVDFADYRRTRTALLDSLSTDASEVSQLEGSVALGSAPPPPASGAAPSAPMPAPLESVAPPSASMPAPLESGAAPSASTPPPLASSPPLAPTSPPLTLTRPRLATTPSDALAPAVSAGRIPRLWRRARARWIAVVALLGLSLLIGALMLHHSGTGAPRDSRASTAAPDRIFDLVAPLMSDPDWSDAHVAAVNAALLEEGSHQIALRQQTVWFQRFATEVRRRLGEQSALGPDHLAPAKNSLAALAVTIGLDPGAPELPLRPPIAGSSAADDSSAGRRQQ